MWYHWKPSSAALGKVDSREGMAGEDQGAQVLTCWWTQGTHRALVIASHDSFQRLLLESDAPA